MDCARKFCTILGVSLNEVHYALYWDMILDSGRGAIFLAADNGEVCGGIGGTLNVNPLTGETMAVEAFWWMDESRRGGMTAVRLHRAFETWASDCGADSVNMVFMEKSMPDRLRGYYARAGYSLLETVWRKPL